MRVLLQRNDVPPQQQQQQQPQGLVGRVVGRSQIIPRSHMPLFQLLPVPPPRSGRRTLASQRGYLWSPPDRLPLAFLLAEVSHIQALPELLKAAVTGDDLARNRSVT